MTTLKTKYSIKDTVQYDSKEWVVKTVYLVHREQGSKVMYDLHTKGTVRTIREELLSIS